jgi:hypothetical protein
VDYRKLRFALHMAGNALHVRNGHAKPTGMDADFPGSDLLEEV